LPKQLSALVTGLWEQLNAHADTRITEHQETSDAALQTSDAKIQALHADNQALIAQKDALAENHHALQNAEKALKTQLIKAEHTIASDNARIDALEKQHESQKTESQRLHELCQHIQLNLEHFQAASQKSTDEQARTFDQQRLQLNQQLQKAQAAHSEVLHDKQLLDAQHGQITQQMRDLKHETHQQKEMITDMQQTRSDAQAQNRMLNEQLSNLKGQRDKQQSDLKKLSTSARKPRQISMLPNNTGNHWKNA